MMNTKELIIQRIEKLPEEYLDEVLDFISLLEEKGDIELAILSESSLKKDWLKPEEDEAWKDL